MISLRYIFYVVRVSLLLVILIATGTAGFMILEGLSPSEALHLTISTITTVGYGDPPILTPEGKMFSNFLMIFGVGIALYALWAIVDISIGTQIRRVLGKRTYRREIGRMKDHVILCGFGRVGESAGKRLVKNGENFVVIEKNPDALDPLPEKVPRIIGDATEDEILKDAGIDRAKAVLIAFGDDSDTILCIVTVKALNPKIKVFARASHIENMGKMTKVGAHKVMVPAVEGGRRMADYAIGSLSKAQ